MAVNQQNYKRITEELGSMCTLVAVSKTKPVVDILALYEAGQKDFGENYVQELVDKQQALPSDIKWHFIGHLQSNKVKYIASFVHLIHGVDSIKLLNEINKQAVKFDRTIDVLLQVHIAREETKFGFNEDELRGVFSLNPFSNLRLRGLMGMASLSNDEDLIRDEFKYLRSLFELFSKANKNFDILSMGMSSDYQLAIQEGSTMVRIGSLLFGERSKVD
jgi:pyridoxal phosphate enzyme (YggS family)